MKHSKGSTHKLLNNEKGHFLAFEWSYLFIVFIILVVILLPDMVNIGRLMFQTEGATSYAIQRVAEQGHMTTEIAEDVIKYKTDRGYSDFEVWGTGTLVGYNSDDPTVEVQVISRYQPHLLRILPNMRVSGSIAVEDGKITISSTKTDVSNVYVRGG